MQTLSHGESRDEGLLSKQKFLERLHNAQDSFPSYRPLLSGPERKLTIDQLTELRPYRRVPAGRGGRSQAVSRGARHPHLLRVS